MQTTGTYIRECRERSGLTLRALGTILGVSRTSVHAWEQDTARPSEEHWRPLAEAIGADYATLEQLLLPPEVVKLRREVEDLRGRLSRMLAIGSGLDGSRP